MKIPRKEFADMASRMEHAIDTKNITLSSIKLEAKPEGIKLSATNLFSTVQGVVFFQNEQVGAWCVPGRTLIDIANSIVGEFLDIEPAGSMLRITSGKSKYNLPVFPVENFPLCPAFENVEFVQMPTEAFIKLFNRLSFAAEEDEYKPYKSGLFLDIGKAVCTNGYVLAMMSNHGVPIKKPALIPAKSVMKIIPFLKDETVGVAQTNSEIHFKSGNMIVSIRLIDQNYPDVIRAIPVHPYQEAVLPKATVVEALKRIKLLSSDTKVIKLTFKSPNYLSVSAESQSGNGLEEFEIKTTSNVEIFFGIDPLLKTLDRIDGDSVNFELRSPKESLVIKEGNYLHVISPRLR